MRSLRDRPEPLRIFGRARGILQHFVAALLQSNQVPREVAAVDRRYVCWLQHLELAQVVPVEEVSLVSPHALERPENFLDPVDHVGSCYESEIDRTHRR